MKVLSDFVESMFFHCDGRAYWKPEHYGLLGKSFKTLTKRGNTLDGLVLESPRAKEKKKVVLYFHSAEFNREFNLPQVVFLAMAGFRVLLFDYSGCGLSTGKCTLDGLGEDAESVLGWLDGSPYKSASLTFFAQGVGCDAALQLMALHPARCNGLILESAYCSRSGWIKERWGPVIGDLAAHALQCHAPDPGSILEKVRVPILLIYPECDDFVRVGQREAVISKTRKASVWIVPGKRFLGIFADAQGKWHQDVVKFIRGTKTFG